MTVTGVLEAMRVLAADLAIEAALADLGGAHRAKLDQLGARITATRDGVLLGDVDRDHALAELDAARLILAYHRMIRVHTSDLIADVVRERHLWR